MQKCCVPYDTHQKVVSAKEDFNNQVDNQPLPLATHVIVQWLMNKSDHGGRDGRYIWFQQHTLSPRPIWLQALLNARMPS